jgi:hypothetical protein
MKGIAMFKLPPNSIGWSKGLIVGLSSAGLGQLFALPFYNYGTTIKVLAAMVGAGLGFWLGFLLVTRKSAQEKVKRDL